MIVEPIIRSIIRPTVDSPIGYKLPVPLLRFDLGDKSLLTLENQSASSSRIIEARSAFGNGTFAQSTSENRPLYDASLFNNFGAARGRHFTPQGQSIPLDSRLDLPDSPVLNYDDLTIVFTLKVAQLPTVNAFVFGKYQDTSTRNEFHFRLTPSGQLQFLYSTSGGNTAATITNPINIQTNQFYVVFVRYIRSTGDLEFGGTNLEDNTSAVINGATNGIAQTTARVSLFDNAGFEGLNGEIRDIYWDNRAWSDYEINILTRYFVSKYNIPDLFGTFVQGFWDFDDTSTFFQDTAGTIPAANIGAALRVNDKSGLNRHMTRPNTSTPFRTSQAGSSPYFICVFQPFADIDCATALTAARQDIIGITSGRALAMGEVFGGTPAEFLSFRSGVGGGQLTRETIGTLKANVPYILTLNWQYGGAYSPSPEIGLDGGLDIDNTIGRNEAYLAPFNPPPKGTSIFVGSASDGTSNLLTLGRVRMLKTFGSQLDKATYEDLIAEMFTTYNRNIFAVVKRGQSLNANLFNSANPGSSSQAAARVGEAVIRALHPNNAAPFSVNAAFGGSFSSYTYSLLRFGETDGDPSNDRGYRVDDTLYNPNGVWNPALNQFRGLRTVNPSATTPNRLVEELNIIANLPDYIRNNIFVINENQSEAEAVACYDDVANVSIFDKQRYKDCKLYEIYQLRAVLPNVKIILTDRARRFKSTVAEWLQGKEASTSQNYQTVREILLEIADELDFVYAEVPMYDLPLVKEEFPNVVNEDVHISENGSKELARRQALAEMRVEGLITGGFPPKVTSVTRTNSTTLTLTVTHDGATGFDGGNSQNKTPISGEGFIKVKQGSSFLALTAVNIIGATTITLTLANPLVGDATLYIAEGSMVNLTDKTQFIYDNLHKLPLRQAVMEV